MKNVYIKCPRCELNFILKKDKLCPVCKQEMREESLPLQHDYQVIDRKEATTAAEGYIKYRCRHCGREYTEVIPRLKVSEPVIDLIIVVVKVVQQIVTEVRRILTILFR